MSRESLMNASPEPASLISAIADINLLDAIRKLRPARATLSAQIALHGQLVKIEWAEEKVRLSKMLAVALLGFVLFLCANIAAGVLLSMLGWQTGYLLATIVALTIVYSVGSWWAWRKLRMLSALSIHSFAASRAELAADIALIRSKL